MGHSSTTQPSPDSSVIRNLPIQERIDWLIEHARRHAQVCQSPESFLARSLYSAKHNTAIIALECMDGLINLSPGYQYTSGIIHPIRNIGGRFDLGWPHFGEVLTEQVQRMVRQGRRSLVLINYHYSKGARHRGCTGWNCRPEPYDQDETTGATSPISTGSGEATVHLRSSITNG